MAGVTLRTYSVPRMRNEALEALDAMEGILALYIRLFGPCPYPALSLVLTEARVPGGHSPPGMVILQRRPLLLRGALEEDPANFRNVPGFFLAHEVAHQWWGHGVAGQYYRERWISEAGAQFAAVLWTREAVGEDASKDVLRQMARWALRFNDWRPITSAPSDETVIRLLDAGIAGILLSERITGIPGFRNMASSLRSLLHR